MHLWQFGTVTIALLLILLTFSSIFLLSEFFLLFYDFLSILFVSRFEGSLGPGFRQVHLTVRSARFAICGRVYFVYVYVSMRFVGVAQSTQLALRDI